MERHFVKDLYQSYKAGTRRAIQWLVDTVGHVSDTASGNAKKHENTALTTRDMDRLGKHILDASDPSRPAPDGIDGFIVVFDTTIAKRREYSRWVVNGPQALLRFGTDEQADFDAHEHFIETFESIRNNMKLARENSKAAAVRIRKPQLKRALPMKSFFDQTDA